uniref:ABC transporter domain-containing protein n=1 Tax=Emiliania huxleyi (strain CCMP1516) TaxID=280463 RepID=A0A0D3I427_EMIH1
MCTDVTHYDNGGQLGKPCRFVYYPMTFSEFQKLKPEIAAGLPRIDSGPPKSASQPASEVSGSEDVSELSESMSSVSVSESNASEGSGLSTTLAKVDEMIAAGLILPMNFPDPGEPEGTRTLGKPEGIRTFRKPVMTLKKCSFKYPETDRYILKEVDATVTLGSRAVIVGGNGSGLSTLLVVGTCKSTFLKLLIGDLEPEEGQGEMWKHHALRLSPEDADEKLEEGRLAYGARLGYVEDVCRTCADHEEGREA